MTSFLSKHKRHRIFLVFAAIFLLSLCLSFMTACDDDEYTSTVKTDNCAIANGNFEYFNDDDHLDLIVSPNSWTKSNGSDSLGNTASSSTRASGIIDTDDELWTSFTTAKNPYDFTGVTVKKAMRQAAKKWDDMSINDHLKFYDELEDAIDEYNDSHDDTLSISDFDEYDDYAYSITYDDVPDCENPGTHDGSSDETAVLMIHNYRSDGYGTAQKYTSSTTVTLDAGTSAKVSLWVKTEDLTYNNGETVDGLRGANISVTHTVGNKTLDQMQIKNINTEGVTENNGWVQYTLYVKACTYATSTFTIVLGLGQGSSTDSWEYVDGYAFFDDVDMDIISNEEYDRATQTNGLYSVPYCTMNSAASDKVFDVDGEYAGEYVYALDLYQALNDFDISTQTTVGEEGNIGLTSTTVNGVTYTTNNYQNLGISTDDDITGLTTWNELNGKTASNKYLSSIWEEDFDTEAYPFDKDDNLLFLMSAHGAAYTARMEATDDLFTLARDQYMLVSFWVKTSDTTGYTGATITLYDEANSTVLGAYNTTTMTTTDLDDEEDIYDGWVQCFFFIENTTFSDRSFYLEFSYGPTTITDTTKLSYSEGYAAFTGFQYYELTETEYNNYAGTASQSTTVSLTGDGAESSSSSFDSVAATQEQTIESTLANASTYTGVNGGSAWTTLDGTASTATNTNANAGLLNKNYVGTYSENAEEWLTNLLDAADLNITDALTNLTWWKEIFGTSNQPLLISNVVEQSYGFLSETYNLSASGYATISIRVKVSKGAKAYIYLVDTSSLFDGYTSSANLDTINVSYWYDDEGNVCMSDPTDDEFDARNETAFYRLDNGLYRNKLDASDETLYFNLANYESDADGNLIASVDSNGDLVVSYEYADEYEDDGIAYYYNEGKYYAYYDADTGEYSTEVKDFSSCIMDGKSFTVQYARYISESYLSTLGVTEADLGENVTVTGLTDTETYIVIDGDQDGVAGKWITVRFYVLTGSDGFNYRLELFSGSRDGTVTSAAGSYVIFDKCDSSDLSSNYDSLLSEAMDELTSENGYTDSRLNETVYLEEDDESGRLVYTDNAANGSKAGSVYDNAEYFCYSFYDDPVFRRYDESLDENEEGNPYYSYTQSTYSETLTYLYYETEITDDESCYCMFLDYSALHQSVTADEGVEDDDDDDDEEWWEDADFWLMLSSIVLAAVLIVVLIVMLIVRMVRSVGKKTQKQDNRYNAKRMRYIRKLNLKTEEEEEDEAEETTESESDDDNPYDE